MYFQYPEDEKFFADLLCGENKKLLKNNYSKLFDFRDPLIKRLEFNKIRKKIFNNLVTKHGLGCQLKLHRDCSKIKRFDVDHFIPLATNELNKKIRKMLPKNGKKVPAQSFGSNHPQNFILACSRCNAFKKHKIIIRK